jgi:hypothetical protein
MQKAMKSEDIVLLIEEGRDTDKSRQDSFAVVQGMWHIG